jgi:hypothetical protein
MEILMISQGRSATATDVEFIQRLLNDHPGWNRTRLSEELCRIWNWCTPSGHYKETACRTLLLKLHRCGHIQLPPPQRPANNDYRLWKFPDLSYPRDPVKTSLATLIPLVIVPVQGEQAHRKLIKCLLHHHHYLGYRGTPGESIGYLVYDRHRRIIACLTFGAAAWKIAPRDNFIAWDPVTRVRNLSHLTNNLRFLILPWVQVPNLASHILSRVVKRLNNDWIIHYKHPLYLVETFVDISQFDGASYKAANWIRVGQTKGRSRQDRKRTLRVPIKDIYLYPLQKFFKEKLNQ